MAVRLSVVIPTCNRLPRLQRCLESLETQTLPRDGYEVIVVVDGSTDGTEAALRSYRPRYPLRVLVQDNRGLSAARNHGNRHAQAPLVLCLDDDMAATPELLAGHVQAHEGRSRLVVQGGLELDESVKRTPFLDWDDRLRREFARDKSRPGARLDGEDVSGGNLSLARELLDEVGGFNESLKGLRNTDGELAYRLQRAGATILYRHRALARMTHSNDLEEALGGAFLYGRAHVVIHRQQPESIWRLSPLVAHPAGVLKRLGRRFYLKPQPGAALEATERRLRGLIAKSERWGLAPLAERLYPLALEVAFFKGVLAEAQGRFADYLPRGVPVLCYHDVSPRKRWRFRNYVLPPEDFARQMRWLKSNGFEAISLDALCDHLERGSPLPRRPVAITFDDGYRDLRTHATPLLSELGFAHTHFLNSGKLDGTTDWVEQAPDLEILKHEDVRDLAARHPLADFQAHGRDHLSMEGIEHKQAQGQVEDCRMAIEAITGRPVRYLAYPFGDYDGATAPRMRALPLRAAFTVDQGLARPGQDPHLIPRVEVFTNDFGFDFRWKLRFGWSPFATLRMRVWQLAGDLRRAIVAVAEGAPADARR